MIQNQDLGEILGTDNADLWRDICALADEEGLIRPLHMTCDGDWAEEVLTTTDTAVVESDDGRRWLVEASRPGDDRLLWSPEGEQ